MMEIELKHTWRVSKRAWYIRFYVWLWQASEKDITFCKLWWGYVLLIPGLIGHLLAVVLGGMDGAIKSYREEHPKEPFIAFPTNRAIGRDLKMYLVNPSPDTHKYIDRVLWTIEGYPGSSRSSLREIGRPFRYRFDQPGIYTIKALINGKEIVRQIEVLSRPSAPMRMLEAISQTPLKVKFAISPIVHSKPVQLLGKALLALMWTGVTVAVIVTVALFGYGVYFAAANLDTWTGAVAQGLSIAFNAAGLYIAGGIIAALLLLLVWNYLFPPTAYVAKKSVTGFREIMKIGYVSVKSNTCPRVEIED